MYINVHCLGLTIPSEGIDEISKLLVQSLKR